MKKISMFLIMMFLFVLTACSNKSFEVTFKVLEDNSKTVTKSFNEGSLIEFPKEPEVEGYRFLYWYLDDSDKAVSDDFKVTENVILTAKFREIKYYTNPLFPNSLGDPHIIRGGEYFYIFATSVGTLRSKDMIVWEDIGPALPERPTWGTPGANFWAPDIVKIGNKFNLYYSLSTWGDANPGIGVAVADSLEGPWIDKGKLFNSEEIGVHNSIDPTVFVGEDNKVYIVWGSFKGVYGVELTADGLALKGGVEYANENKKLVAGFETSTVHYASTYEGTYIRYINGYYYMFVSSGNCCEGLNSSYNVRVSRSKDPLGPYIDHENKDMFGENRGYQVVKGSAMMAGPGHNSIIKDDNGDYFIVYHVFKNTNGEHNGRQLAIDKLLWDDLGWPSVENQMPSYRPKEAPYFK